MPLYKKSTTIESITTDELLAQGQKSCIVYDTDMTVHYFYFIDSESTAPSLLRFVLAKLPPDVPYSLRRAYHPHNAYHLAVQKADEALFKQANAAFMAINKPSCYFSETEINALREAHNNGVRPEATVEDDWYIQTSPLTNAQQQQLLYGQITAINIGSFYKRIEALTLNTLEACIRADDTSALNLSEEEQVEVGVLRGTYLYPDAINKFKLTDQSTQPTLGDIHSLFVETIKQHILKKAPERAAQLQQLQTLKQSGQIRLGEKSPDFKNEGLFNPQGLSEVDDNLFRAAHLILGSRPDDLGATVQSIIEAKGFDQAIIERHLLTFLKSLDTLHNNPDDVSSMPYRAAIDYLVSYFGANFYQEGQLVKAKAILEIFAVCKINGIVLSEDDRNAVMKLHWPAVIAEILSFLCDEQMITPENVTAAIHHRASSGLLYALSLFKENGGLNAENCKHVLTLQTDQPLMQTCALFYPKKYALKPLVDGESLSARESALQLLYEKKILTEANINTVYGHRDPFRIAQNLVELHQTPLDNQPNRDAVLAHAKPGYLAYGLRFIKEAGLLTQENFDTLCIHRAPSSLGKSFLLLQQNKLYNADNRESVLKHNDPENIASGLSFLDKGKLFTQEHVELVCNHREPRAIGQALFLLNQYGLLKPEYLNRIKDLAKLDAISTALSKLDEVKQINAENFEIVISHRNPWSASDALVLFNEHDWFTPAQRSAVLAHDNPSSIANSLIILDKSRILHDPYEQAVRNYRAPELMAKVLSKLNDLGVLNKESLDATLAYHAPIDILIMSYGRIGLHLTNLHQLNLLTLDVFNLLLRTDFFWSLSTDLQTLAKDGKLFEQPQVINALHAFKIYIDSLPPQPDDWKKKARELYQYAINELRHQTDKSVKPEAAKAFAQTIVNKAQSLWGTDYQAARMILDVLMITLAFAGVGLAMIGVKYAKTGHGFFYFGKQQDRDAVNDLTSKLSSPKPGGAT